MTKHNITLPRIGQRLLDCLRDESGQAMAEYLVVTSALLPVVFWLFHPDNGLFKSARDHYDLTTLLLVFPGP